MFIVWQAFIELWGLSRDDAAVEAVRRVRATDAKPDQKCGPIDSENAHTHTHEQNVPPDVRTNVCTVLRHTRTFYGCRRVCVCVCRLRQKAIGKFNFTRPILLRRRRRRRDGMRAISTTLRADLRKLPDQPPHTFKRQTCVFGVDGLPSRRRSAQQKVERTVTRTNKKPNYLNLSHTINSESAAAR